MKKHTTSDRLKQIMSERNLKQIDILNLASPYCKKYEIKLNKNDLSQYVSGKVEPGQNKLYILGLALNVSEAWLMGFDVPMNKSSSNCYENNSNNYLSLTQHENKVITAYRNKPEMQPAVDKILEIEPEYETVLMAARSKDNKPISYIEIPKSKLDLFDSVPPVTNEDDI